MGAGQNDLKGREARMWCVKLGIDRADEILWPKQCPACAKELNEGEGIIYNINVQKGRKAKSASGTPNSIPLEFCSRCSSRRSLAGIISDFGWGLVMIAFLGAVIFHPDNELQWVGAGGVFWLGVIIGWWWDNRKKSSIGVEINRVSKDERDFWFRNEGFADAFLQINQVSQDPADVHYNRGVGYEGQGKLDEAIREYQEALRVNPNHVDAHCNLGTDYYE